MREDCIRHEWKTVERYSIEKKLRKGRNCVVVMLHNEGSRPNAAGLLLLSTIEHINTGSNWKGKRGVNSSNWMQTNYNDKSWPRTEVFLPTIIYNGIEYGKIFPVAMEEIIPKPANIKKKIELAEQPTINQPIHFQHHFSKTSF